MKKKAFTLVEIMAVVALIAILFVIFIPRIGFAANKTKITGVQADFRSYETALQSVGVENTTLANITKEQLATPEKAVALTTKINGYLDPALQVKADEFGVLSTEKKDPWGSPYAVGYSEPDDAFYLYSFGADKVPGKEYKHVPTEAVGDDLIMVERCNLSYTYGFPINIENNSNPNLPVLMTGLTITKAPTKLVYQIGENFDPTGMEVKASYSNGTEGVITDYIVTDGTKMAAGKSVVTISYTEETVTKTALQSIEVKNPLVSIKIGTEPTKKDYIVGENFDSAGMVVVATYTDGSSVPVSKYTVTCGNPLTDKDVSVIVPYTEDGITKTVSQAITVTNPLASIAITKTPTKTEYIAGTNFDVTGMVVTATYTNKNTKVIPISEYKVTDGANLTNGKQNVTISYTESGITKTVIQIITVTNPLVSIKIGTGPSKKDYDVGENFSSIGMVVIATYANSETKTVTEYTVINGKNLAVERTNVTISYMENGVVKTTDQIITVKNLLSSIAVTKAPTKTIYIVGDNFDFIGMEITATYVNGAKKIVNGWVVNDGAALPANKNEVSISYTEGKESRTVSQPIKVKNPLISIIVSGEPTKKSYSVGETFDPTGMVVTATYKDNNTKTISKYVVVDGANLATNKTSVTISYSEDGITKTVTQSITIKNELSYIEVTNSPYKTMYAAGETFNSYGMQITATYTNGTRRVVSGWATSGGSWLSPGYQMITVYYSEGGISKTTSVGVFVEANKSGTKFTYSDGSVETVNVTGELSHSDCNIPYKTQLIGIEIGRGVTAIGSNAFQNHASLSSVTIPNTVTSIGGYAFYGTSIRSVTIPSSVRTIAFAAFPTFTSITFEGMS